MILVDTALARREAENNPVRVALAGPGYLGRAIARQLLLYSPGIRLVAIYGRNLAQAAEAYSDAGAGPCTLARRDTALTDAINRGTPVVTDDWRMLCRNPHIDVLLDITGSIPFGARFALEAIDHRKPLILNNAELDGTIGPLLKHRADRAGSMLTTSDGDQPGVQMNLYRQVRGMGMRPILCGNVKGFQDRYRNPSTQAGFARAWQKKPEMVSSFADGTKMTFEQTVVANATGMRVARRGMTGTVVPPGTPLEEAIRTLPLEEAASGPGFVDFVVGAAPPAGVFVVGTTDDPVQRHHLNFYKLGEGPFYLYYTPYHLCHFEVPTSIARVVLFNDTVGAPVGPPMVEVITVAKTDLRAGTVLDGIGKFTTYGLAENADTAHAERLVPIGVAEGCRLVRDVKQDRELTYDDVEIVPGRLIDSLRKQQDDLFFGREATASPPQLKVGNV